MGMRSCDSRCLFSGSKGEVCCIEPLRTPPDFRDHPITCYSLLAMASLTKWINSGTLVLVDSHEKLHVVDRPSQEVLETLDLEQVQLVYNSRHFKSLATGGNVSQALVSVVLVGWQLKGHQTPAEIISFAV
ncbi:hypothetical protein GOODEAATRI_011020 [Goodea atripinnis]|uniref:Uncharacterized protein n=1 Tax=Goodea atripinnis TaxID=208336 RepID=A0ABV0NTJ7_9TELE